MPFRLGQVFTVVVTIAMSGTGAVGDPLARLQGAWGAIGIACDKIFTAEAGRTTFIRYYGEKPAGFIADGKKIQSAQATCNVVSSKEKVDLVTLLLECREEIIFDRVSISLRFIDATTVDRFDQEFPDIGTRFNRCSR